jgi:hypothetical protein
MEERRLPKPPSSKEEMKPKNVAGEPTGKGTTLFRYGLALTLLASLLIITEGIIIIIYTPLAYHIQLLADWGGYLDLLLGILALMGFLAIAFMHQHRIVRTISAATVCFLSILSFILFGGGFYLGFILGLFGALLTAARE